MTQKQKIWSGVSLLCLFLLVIVIVAGAFYRHRRQEELDNALTHAVLMGDLPSTQVLLRQGADANAAWGQESHFAPSTFLEFCKQMLRIENRRLEGRMTILMGACADGEMPMVKQLVEAGADVNARDNYGYTPLLYAAGNIRGDGAPIIRLLVKYGADRTAKNNEGNTAWNLAGGDQEITHALNHPESGK